MTRKREKNILYEVFPAEKRLARIDELDLELERKRPSLSVPEYMRAKQALHVRRLQEHRRLERAGRWDLPEPEPPKDDPEPVAPDPSPPPVPETPRKRRLLHYALFWVDLVALSLLICWLAPYLKK